MLNISESPDYHIAEHMLTKAISILKKVMKGRSPLQNNVHEYRGYAIWNNNYTNEFDAKYITYCHK